MTPSCSSSSPSWATDALLIDFLAEVVPKLCRIADLWDPTINACHLSSAGRDHTRRFPTRVATIASLVPSTFILDGEVCIFDERFISRFEWIRVRTKAGIETATVRHQ